MFDFNERPASKSSLKRRRLIYGVGINDADYIVTVQDENKRLLTCPYYKRWSEMLKRCYSEKYHQNKPTYIGCSVVDEWKRFSNFREWMGKQDWKGKHLDKDILQPGNRVYGPDRCVFVSQELNSLLSHERSSCGRYPLGVSLKKGVYVVRCNIGSKRVYIGQYDSEEKASKAYRKAKYLAIIKASDKNPELKESLTKRAVIELNGGLYD